MGAPGRQSDQTAAQGGGNGQEHEGHDDLDQAQGYFGQQLIPEPGAAEGAQDRHGDQQAVIASGGAPAD